ncbi:peroxidase family protein [Variovorax guangxiensis]|uniref:peroxidase family protein n=1 Tax=Variovorax guangxiensis TaxID=1775474 RepID=UPI00285FB2E9|nr:peroxidase family protein [Variovorax guangxiensis]MDR6854266.1 hypothetical protein [Variovorax guangxiensis]
MMGQRGRHGRESYLIGTKLVTMQEDGTPMCVEASTLDLSTQFRFSHFAGDGVVGTPLNIELLAGVAAKMTSTANQRKDGDIPAGYTYLGQFVDHDMTLDPTQLDINATPIRDLQSLRSPTLDLDSLYGRGPDLDPDIYEADKLHIKTHAPFPVPGIPALAAQKGFDLPRRQVDSAAGPARQALIPDGRNDENLAVAQVHLAFIRFHNRVVDDLIAGGSPSAGLFERAQEKVVLHYQFLLKTDYLPRIAKKAVVDDVYDHGRKVFEVDGDAFNATMPVEFSGAAFRLGHSMIRTGYSWNSIFPGFRDGHIFRLFRFSGTSGTLLPTQHPPGSQEDIDNLESGPFGTALPSNWVADWPRLFDFGKIPDAEGTRAPNEFNFASFMDTTLVNPLESLPAGSFGATSSVASKRNLAFRNLVRGNMLGLPSGEQLFEVMSQLALDVDPLSESDINNGTGTPNVGVVLTKADIPRLDEMKGKTPLWFYILREAEFGSGKLAGVGARIVAETFHRAMQASKISLLNRPFQVEFGPGKDSNRFEMPDLLFYAYDGDPKKLNPTKD